MSQGKTILVVEDDDDIREFVRAALEDQGYVIKTATNGQAALDKVRRCPPDAILLDIMMPRLDGWCFLKAYRTLSAQYRAPILVISAAGGWSMARELGAADFLAKPFGLDALLGKVAALC